ncbi:MAG: hypothetical protein B7X06_02125, partial [Verrucomicrobia bacterium 21-51-4]
MHQPTPFSTRTAAQQPTGITPLQQQLNIIESGSGSDEDVSEACLALMEDPNFSPAVFLKAATSLHGKTQPETREESPQWNLITMMAESLVSNAENNPA